MIELNKVYNEDCLQGMKRIDDNSIDLVVTSPPYNFGFDYKGVPDNLTENGYEELINKSFAEFKRLLKPDGRVCVVFSQSLYNQKMSGQHFIETALKKSGLNYKFTVWWIKTKNNLEKGYDGGVNTAWGSFCSASSPYIIGGYEQITIGYNEQWKKQQKGTSTISKKEFIKATKTVWNILRAPRNKHPATFPKEIPQHCINLFSYENDLVLDPFAGIGTTLCVAKRLKRKFIGFELSKPFYDIAVQNLNQKYIGAWV